MKSTARQIKIVVLLSLAILCVGLDFGTAVSAQQSRNERVVGKPNQTPIPKQTATPKPSVAPTFTPTPAMQTVADLQAKIRAVLSRPELRRGQIGVKIVSLDTDKTLFEENAEKYFMPASNMKSFTVAAALEKLSPDFRFVTSVFAPVKPDANGIIKGDLSIYGRGDVSFSTAFYDGDYYKGLNALADKIAASGVKRVEGNLVGDESYFSGNPIPEGWEWDDLQWYYGAEISALAVNDNAVDLQIKPGSVNSQCAVQISPANTIVKIINRCVTSAVGIKRDLRIIKKIDQNTVEISGSMPADDAKGFEGYLAISRPAALFVEILRGLLTQKGITITGQNRIINADDKANLNAASNVSPVEIARIESPPLSVIAAKTLKPSQNTYTETILWTLGEQARINPNLVTNFLEANTILRDPKSNSAARGLFVVRNFLNEVGVPSDGLVQYDGSGLSRHNLVTPAALVQLYTYMSKSRYASVWRDALTIGGTDGTLQNRFKNTLAAANVRGKTGTIDQVSALSGYVNSAAGERFVFSIIVNGVANGRLRQATIDEIVVDLAEFNGKTN